MDDAHSDSDTSDEYTERIHTSGEYDGVTSLESIGIDDWCDSIRCVVESVDKLECTDEEETEPEGDIEEIHKKK